MRKIETLNGLRGIAVLMVLLQHLPIIAGARIFNTVANFFQFGYLGVDIFFVLSGFLITRILIAEKADRHYSFKKFYLKRILRIFPIYYLTIFIVSLIAPVEGKIPILFYFSNYYFAFNRSANPLSHVWSLSVEEHFYLLWPLLINFLPLSGSRKVTAYLFPAFALITAIMTILIFTPQLANDLIYRGTTYRIIALSLGSFMAFREDRLKLTETKTLGILLAACCILFFLNAYSIDVPALKHIPRHFIHLILLTPVSCMLFIICFRLNFSLLKIKYIFTNKVISFIGKISYGIYLYHFPVLFLYGLIRPSAHAPVAPETLLLPLTLIFMLPVVSYYIIERPFLNLKNRLKVS